MFQWDAEIMNVQMFLFNCWIQVVSHFSEKSILSIHALEATILHTFVSDILGHDWFLNYVILQNYTFQ